MIPNSRNQKTLFHSSNFNGLLPNQTLLDVDEQQNYRVFNKQQTILQHQPELKDEREEDLINLMDDFCISRQNTPEVDKEKQIADFQMKMLEEFLSTSSKTKVQKSQTFTPEQEKEFQKFFDKYEAATKSEKSVNITELLKETPCTSDSNKNHYIGNPIILTPKLDKYTIEKDIVNEDLIDELLLGKNLEKQLWRNPSNINHCNNADKLNPQTPTSSQDNNDACKENRDIMSDIITSNHIDFPAFKLLDENAFHASMLKNRSKTITNNLNLQSYLSLNKEKSVNSYPKININELVTKHNIKYLEAVKKDEKLFQKRNMLKSDAEKVDLTPGPTLYEKSAVLPQIMQRLSERKKVVTELTNMKRKLIHDVGPSQIKPIIDEKEKPKINVIASSKTEPVKQTSGIQYKSTIYATASNSNQTPAPFVTFNRIPSPGLKLNPVIAEKNENINKRDFNYIPVENLRNLRREQILAGQGPSYMYPASEPHVLQPPQLLKENCNKERYLAHATTALFSDFVNGKIGTPK